MKSVQLKMLTSSMAKGNTAIRISVHVNHLVTVKPKRVQNVEGFDVMGMGVLHAYSVRDKIRWTMNFEIINCKIYHRYPLGVGVVGEGAGG